MLTRQETLLGRGPGGEQQSEGNQESCSAVWLAVSGFMVMGFVSRLSPANHSDSGSFLVARAAAQPRWIPARRILGGWQGMWTGVSSLFLTCSLKH